MRPAMRTILPLVGGVIVKDIRGVGVFIEFGYGEGSLPSALSLASFSRRTAIFVDVLFLFDDVCSKILSHLSTYLFAYVKNFKL